MDKRDTAIKRVADGSTIWTPGSRYAWLATPDFSQRVFYHAENYFLYKDSLP